MSRSKTYYRTCSECGCNLDPGEICDCKKESSPPAKDHPSAPEVMKEVKKEVIK